MAHSMRQCRNLGHFPDLGRRRVNGPGSAWFAMWGDFRAVNWFRKPCKCGLKAVEAQFMIKSNAFAFCESGLDRASELRGKSDVVSGFLKNGMAKTALFWRGKPLVGMPGENELAWFSPKHPILASAGEPVLLGRDEDGTLLMAADLRNWQPDDFDETRIQGIFDSSLQMHPALGDGMAFAELRRIMNRLGARDAELAATAKALLGWHETHRYCSRCGLESSVAMSGWQRICESCGGQHFPRTDPVVIMLVTRGNKALLGRSRGWPEGMYSCLAGFVDPGETIEAAVRREVLEEVGIATGKVRYIASQPWAFPSSLMIGCATEALEDEISIDENELENALWISREGMAASYAGQTPEIRPARKGSIAHYLITCWLAGTLQA